MTGDSEEAVFPMNEVMEDIRPELIRRVAGADRDENREIYEALDSE